MSDDSDHDRDRGGQGLSRNAGQGRRDPRPRRRGSGAGRHVFQAGTAEQDGQLVASGGRVLAVTARGRSLGEARERAYRAVDAIDLPTASIAATSAGASWSAHHEQADDLLDRHSPRCLASPRCGTARSARASGWRDKAEASARRMLDHYELPMIQAQMQRGPLARRLILSGPADDFQRAELVRILDETPGVLDVRWDPASLPQERRRRPMIPLAIEAQLLGLTGFALGMLLAYIGELRRRANQWKKRI